MSRALAAQTMGAPTDGRGRTRLRAGGRSGALAVGALFVGAVALLAQLAFSALGFNPTDDGFILAYSRRLLDGQVPHRDFISIRPVGSALLHLPLVAWGGGWTFWLDRLVVWAEFAAIGWLWSGLLASALVRPTQAAVPLPSASLCGGRRVALALITAALCAHTFPLMAWHTTDGLLLCVMGLALLTGARPGTAAAARCTWMRLGGYALIGAAALCKQNYGLLAPGCLVLLGDARHLRYWAAAAAPALLYAAALAALGGLGDAVAQLAAQSDLVQAGVRPYLVAPVALGAALGYVVVRAAHRRAVAPLGVLLVGALALSVPAATYYGQGSFALFGLAAGATGALVVVRQWALARHGACGVLAAWSASISLGYNSPALAGGLLASFVMCALLARAAQRPGGAPWSWSPLPLALLAVLVCTLGAVGTARLVHVYGDRPAAQLTARLDGVLPGGAGLRTNPLTAAVLADLRRATGLARGRYAIVPDGAGWWVAAGQANPLPIDWPQSTELARPALLRRVTRTLERARGHLVVIVERVDVAHLAQGVAPLPAADYAVVRYVHAHWHVVRRTAFFDLYA